MKEASDLGSRRCQIKKSICILNHTHNRHQPNNNHKSLTDSMDAAPVVVASIMLQPSDRSREQDPKKRADVDVSYDVNNHHLVYTCMRCFHSSTSADVQCQCCTL